MEGSLGLTAPKGEVDTGNGQKRPIQTSEEPGIDDLSVPLPGELAEFMRFGGSGRQNVQHRHTTNQEGIREQPAVTLPPHGLGTHNRGSSAFANFSSAPSACLKGSVCM